MFKAIIALSALISSTSFASVTGYEMKLELAVDGKVISSPRIVAVAGEKASITQRIENSKDGSFIEVVATESKEKGSEGIRMNFVVGTIDRDGKKTILATPTVLSRENETSQVKVNSAEGKKDVSLSVTAQRKSLQE